MAKQKRKADPVPELQERNCTCGHHEDEHGDDPEYPGSSKCNIDDCDCVCFELDAEE